MRLITNYRPLGDAEAGSKQALWGVECTLENIGTDDDPKLAYVVEVADKAEAETMIATGRFQAENSKASKAGKAE